MVVFVEVLGCEMLIRRTERTNIQSPLTDMMLTSAPALASRVAMSSLPCLAAQCSAVCRERKRPESHQV